MRRLLSGAAIAATLVVGPVAVPLSDASATANLSVTPNSLHFGAVPVGTPSATEQVTLTNNTGTTLDVNMGTTDPSYSLTPGSPVDCGTTLAGGQSCEKGVVFTPQSTGQDPANLQVFYKLASCTMSPTCTTTVSVHLRGRGT